MRLILMNDCGKNVLAFAKAKVYEFRCEEFLVPKQIYHVEG